MLDWCGTINIRFDLQLNSGTIFPHTCVKVSLNKTAVCGAVNALLYFFWLLYRVGLWVSFCGLSGCELLVLGVT